MRDRTLGAVMILVSAVGFGTLPIFGKFAELRGLSRPTLLLFRFVVGALVVWGFLAVRREPKLLTGPSAGIAVLLGVVYGTFTIAYFWGLSFLTASLAAIVFYTYPVYVVVLSAAFLDEGLTPRLVVALALALGGVVLVAGADVGGPDRFGIALVIAGAVGVAIYIVGGRAYSPSIGAPLLTAHVLVVAAGVLGLRWLQAGPSLPVGVDQWVVVLGIGVFGTSVPLVLFYEGLEHITANHASVLSTAEPVAAVTMGVTLLGETVTWTTLVGGVLVLAGVALVQLDERARARISEGLPGRLASDR